MKHYPLPPNVQESSLRPYPGRLFIAYNKKAYEAITAMVHKDGDKLDGSEGGKYSYNAGRDGISTYVIYACNGPYWMHEICHVVLHLFSHLQIHPSKASGEPMCYLVQSIYEDVLKLRKSNYTEIPDSSKPNT